MRVWIMFGLAVASSSATAASFDCARASTRVEQAICADQQLSGLDDSLAAAYKAATSGSSNAGATRIRQREWLASERNKCKDAACIRDAYTRRLAELSSRSNSAARDAFERAAQHLVSRTSIPVYIPTLIPDLKADAKDLCADGTADSRSFSITLSWRSTEYGKTEPLPCGGGGDAALLAGIHGDSKPMADLSARAQKVALRNGTSGWFLPASCGGSCAPATLYWQTPQASYWIQMKFGSTDQVVTQRKQLLDAVNSVELVPRK